VTDRSSVFSPLGYKAPPALVLVLLFRKTFKSGFCNPPSNMQTRRTFVPPVMGRAGDVLMEYYEDEEWARGWPEVGEVARIFERQLDIRVSVILSWYTFQLVAALKLNFPATPPCPGRRY
jgi:hypothetical protein